MPVRRASAVALLLLIGGLTTLLAVASSDEDSPPHLIFGGPQQYHGAYLLPPLPRPDFTLTDTADQPFAFKKATNEQLTLLFFGYTHCPDVCPTTMADIAAGLGQLSAEARASVKVVFVTTDPRRDKPGVLREWLDNFDPSFVGLTGTQTDINRLLESLRLPNPAQSEMSQDGYIVSHSSDVLLFTPDNVAHLVYVGGAAAADWAADLTKLLRDGFKKPSS